MIITIVHSAFCCSGMRDRSNSSSTQQVTYDPQQIIAQPQPQPQPQYVQGPNGQIMMVVNQNVPPQPVQQSTVFQQAPSVGYPVGARIPAPTEQQEELTYEIPTKAPPMYNAVN